MNSPSLPARAAIIEPVGGHGGMNHYDFSLCRALNEAGVDVALYTSDATTAPSERAFAFHPVYRGVFAGAPAWTRVLRYLRGTLLALAASVREERSVCHFHFFQVGPLELLNVVLARLLRRKVVITAHDVEAFVASRDVPGMPRAAYTLAHGVIAHNLTSRCALVDRMKLKGEKIIVIPQGNSMEAIPARSSATDARRALSLPTAGRILLFFGQIKEVKGLDLLLRAMPAILAEHPHTILVIAGRPWGTRFSDYQALIERLGIARSCVTRIHFIPDDDLPLFYQACDLVILPYRRIYQSAVLLMALGFGKAVLTSDIPGMTDIVSDGDTGFLFRSEDPEDLARAANRALSSPDTIAHVAERGHRLVVQRHAWGEIGRATARFYQSIR